MILYGASGHGKVILDILKLQGEKEISVCDDRATGDFCGIKVERPEEIGGWDSRNVVVGIGINTVRKKVVEKLDKSITFGHGIHPKAVIAEGVKVGEGTVVMAGAVINPGAEVGRHCIVNTCASIDHDCILEDYVHISPNATLSGNVVVGTGTHFGSGAVSIQGIRIGKWCTIGAGTVVIRDVPDFSTVVGNPGRIIKRKEQLDEV